VLNLKGKYQGTGDIDASKIYEEFANKSE